MKLLMVDAFSDRPFAGNPAAVCLLDADQSEGQDADWMQAVAGEMNLSETAFVAPAADGVFLLRWFTPVTEVELCGHATLASAHALWTEGIVDPSQPIRFHTKSGVLTCRRNNELIELDFPATPVQPVDPPAGLIESLAVSPRYVGETKFDKFLVVGSEQELRNIQPDFTSMAGISMRGVIVTSTSRDPSYDFVSRFFAPACGVDEDPVTGSAHCALAPYWCERLGKTALTGFQASKRGGVVQVRVSADRVVLGGYAVTVMKGELLTAPKISAVLP